ncbi:MAG TPA: histone H1 [Cytophagales bacterium]|nr:histone H1 [Cytophagales bacterium]
MKRFEQIKDLVLSLEADFVKFYDKENQAAGTRVRKGLQDLKNLSQEIRIEVQNSKTASTSNN